MTTSAAPFADRHIGPSAADVAHMLAALGVGVARRADRPGRPRLDPRRQAAGAGGRRVRGRGHRPPPRPGRPQPGRDLAHRHRLLRHPHAGGDPAQRAGEPGLVHGLHAVPARDQPGPAGGAAQLPDDGVRPHGHGDRQRLDARRGHGRRRGHDPGPPLDPARGRRLLRGRRVPPPDRGRGGHPGRAARHPGGGGRPRHRPGARRRVRRAAPAPRLHRRRAGPAPGRRRRARGRRPGRGGHRPAGLHAAGAAGRARGRRRRGVVAAVRGADGLRRPPRRVPGHPRPVPAVAARPAGGRVRRRRRPPGPPAGAADPRAAHPPREGHVQHLHRPGAAGRDGLDVRRLPRARRPHGHRPGRPRPGRHRGRPAAGGGLRPGPRHVVRHAHRPRPRPGGRDRRAGPPGRAEPAPGRGRRPGPVLRRDDGPRPRAGAGRLRHRHRPGRARRRQPPAPASPPASAARARSSPTRCSTSTGPRPRCCATCGAWPTRTWPSTGP